MVEDLEKVSGKGDVFCGHDKLYGFGFCVPCGSYEMSFNQLSSDVVLEHKSTSKWLLPQEIRWEGGL